MSTHEKDEDLFSISNILTMEIEKLTLFNICSIILIQPLDRGSVP